MWQAHRVGRSEHGTWLYTPANTAIQTVSGEVINTRLTEGVQLLPADGWWVAWWWADGTMTVEVATPVVIEGSSVEYTSLELNLTATEKGESILDGQDDYVAAREAGLITGVQDDEARSAASTLVRQLADRAEPFGEKGWEWLNRVRRNELHVIAYDAGWPARFVEAREAILPVLPAGSRVEHFGSTSVPGLAAKDCIDIAVITQKQDQFNAAIAGLESIGYEARPAAFDDPGHIFIRRLNDDGRRTHHLHLYHDGHPNLIEVMAFRDLLRSDPTARRRYEAVKLDLADANPYDRAGYLAGKTEVVQDLLRVALARRSSRAYPK
jgi:GrpB-like predicted nucleotidyltransferase (UPF0157 family)